MTSLMVAILSSRYRSQATLPFVVSDLREKIILWMCALSAQCWQRVSNPLCRYDAGFTDRVPDLWHTSMIRDY